MIKQPEEKKDCAMAHLKTHGLINMPQNRIAAKDTTKLDKRSQLAAQLKDEHRVITRVCMCVRKTSSSLNLKLLTDGDSLMWM